MESEHSEQATQFDDQAFAWNVFQYWTATEDAARFREAYLGHYADREAFGQQLLRGLGAEGPLERLPEALRPYIRLDGEALVADFERAGQLYLCDAPHGKGTFVFDTRTEAPEVTQETVAGLQQ